MARRSPARFLAPLALVAVSVALFMVVTDSQQSSDGSGSPNRATDARPTATATPERKGPRRYRVIGPLRNLDAWYAAFDIKPGSKFYIPPEKRVRIW